MTSQLSSKVIMCGCGLTRTDACSVCTSRLPVAQPASQPTCSANLSSPACGVLVQIALQWCCWLLGMFEALPLGLQSCRGMLTPACRGADADH